jgi:hypothetical protein
MVAAEEQLFGQFALTLAPALKALRLLEPNLSGVELAVGRVQTASRSMNLCTAVASKRFASVNSCVTAAHCFAL